MENNINRMPLIGDIAPSFKAVTTQGNISFPEDYKGKWVILFSHPADFTPVCTTEFMTFASMEEEFKAMNTELVGLSVDSLYAHIAWLRKIQELSWNGKEHVEVKFPLIEDIRMEVANKYGMIQPGQSNTQAVSYTHLDVYKRQAMKVGRKRKSPTASSTPSTAAMPMTIFSAFSLPSFFSSQRSNFVGSSCSSSGRRLAE